MKHFVKRIASWSFEYRSSLLIAILLLTLPSILFAQEPESMTSRVIVVVGEGSASQPPETMTLSLSISSQDVTASTVFAKHDVGINHLKQALQDAGISSDDITEGVLSMNPTYDYSQAGQSPRLVGYHLLTPILVRVEDIKTLPHILDVATQSGASNVSIGGFGMRKQDYLREEATKIALKDAHERAEDLAKLIGASLGDIVSVSDMEAEGKAQEREGMPGKSLEKHVELKVVYALK